MKAINSILLLIIILIVVQSCKKDAPAPDFRDPASAECLLSIIYSDNDTTSIIYDANMKVTRIEWSPDEYMDISYENDGKINRIDEFYPNNEAYYTTYTWSDNQIEAIFYESVQGQWVTSSKRISELNESNEVVKITDYSKNTNGDWIESGDYYLFEWSNGNMIKTENWDNYSSPAKKNLKEINFPSIIYSAKQAYLEKKEIKSLRTDYNLYSSTTFEYDEKINPSRYLTIWNLFIPDEFNSSRNNWIKTTYTDINNREIISIYDYTYNDKNLPVSLNTEETNKYPNGTFVNNYFKKFEYDCK